MSAVQVQASSAAPTGAPEPSREWLIPGKGQPARGCGEWAPNGFCEAGHVSFGVRRFGRRDCPDCWSSRWAGPATARVASRVAAYRHSVDGAAKRTIHVTISPPPDELPMTPEGVTRARRKAYDIAREHGVIGGPVITHCFRPTEAAKADYREASTHKKIWRWIRENEASWRDMVYWSPHFHIVGVVDSESVDPETGRPGHVEPGQDRADGWVFKNIRSLERYNGPGDMEGMKDMVGLVRYLLSHASFPADEDRQVITWFGALSGRTFDPEAAVALSAWRRIQADAERLTGAEVDQSEGLEEPGEVCEVDGCEASVVDIWAWPEWRRQHDPEWSDDRLERVDAAYRWSAGSAKPPPGAKGPRSPEAADEALGLIVDRFGAGSSESGACSVCGRWSCKGHLGRAAR